MQKRNGVFYMVHVELSSVWESVQRGLEPEPEE
jgi:hypothetical protein